MRISVLESSSVSPVADIGPTDAVQRPNSRSLSQSYRPKPQSQACCCHLFAPRNITLLRTIHFFFFLTKHVKIQRIEHYAAGNFII